LLVRYLIRRRGILPLFNSPSPRSSLDVCRVIELLDRLQRSGELPPPKLQALQRVLQSKFCAAIREVDIRITYPLCLI
jgi:hypothetical protein